MYARTRLGTETRGMDKHMELPTQNPIQWHRPVSSGLDTVWIQPGPAAHAVAVVLTHDTGRKAAAA